jgi:thioredoxin reductase (NADPH)
MKTEIKGVFAAGDCIAKRYRQVTTAVADGTIAALSAAEYVRSA